MVPVNCYKVLTEAGIEVDRARFMILSEEAKLQVTDQELTGLMKFITDKYNSIDFADIERSAGDYSRFKYNQMILENAKMLQRIYESSPDSGAKKYMEVISAIQSVDSWLMARRQQLSQLYKAGNGLVQLLYTSLVAAMLYATGTLVTNTIRFVTTEQDTDCEVLYDEIPGSIKHVHIRNILAAARGIPTYSGLLDELSKSSNRNLSESVTVSGVATAVMAIGAVIMLVPRVIYLIREIIYSVFYSRVKVSEMIGVQVDLINTNVESLEARGGSKKVIARQKRIAKKLEAWKNKIAVKMDTTETTMRNQVRKENTSLRIDRDSPIVTAGDDFSGVLI